MITSFHQPIERQYSTQSFTNWHYVLGMVSAGSVTSQVLAVDIVVLFNQ